MFKQVLFILIFLCFYSPLFLSGQVKINEYLSSNATGIVDEDYEKSDWIEIFNSSKQVVDIDGYVLSEDTIALGGWEFPSVKMNPESFLLVFASGKNRNDISYKYKTLINQGDSWKYSIIVSSVQPEWKNVDFNDSAWKSGSSGFGFGDQDDNTVLTGVAKLCIRKEFYIDDIESVKEILLHVDYDDGFVAFINGKILTSSENVSYNEEVDLVSINGDHEAQMYKGGDPELFKIEPPYNFLQKGKNVLAIMGLNVSTNSSDFTLIPFLTIGSLAFTVNETSSFIKIGEKVLHTDFKISNEGEAIYLFDKNKKLIDSLVAVPLVKDISYGRFPDGAHEWFYFTSTTPGNKNINPIKDYTVDSVIFSSTSGIYDTAISLKMDVKATGGVIRYTNDGSIPGWNSSVYLAPLNIDKTTVVRASFFKDENKVNPVTTCTYIFEQNNSIPVISLAMNPHDLFDWDEGIYVDGPNAEIADPHHGANYWMDWEKPVNFEFLDNLGKQQLNQGAGIKISGNWSRARPQKSMALYARSKYGKGDFDCKFFHDRTNDSFESINLRNSGNDWSSVLFRDGLVSEIAKDMNIDRLAYQPSIIYLNGEYWGILNLREKPSEHYFADNYGVAVENVNLLENNGNLIEGNAKEYSDLKSFIGTNDLTREDNYKYVSGLIDIDCFIDYQILEIFIHNGDWPGNNIKFWNTANAYSKFRWLIFDTDFGLDLYYSSDINSMEFAATEYGPDWPNPPWSTLFLRKLLDNKEFRTNFINRFMDCLNTNLSAYEINEKVDSIRSMLNVEMLDHTERWGNISYSGWISEVERIKSFVILRNSRMRDYIKSFFSLGDAVSVTINVSDKEAGNVKVNTVIPSSYPFSGKYFMNLPITLTAIPEPGYKFVRWEGSSDSPDIKITRSLNFNEKYTAVFEPAAVPGKFIVINEINYNSPIGKNSGDWIEIHNPGNQAVDLSAWFIQDYDSDNSYIFPNGKVIYPGEYLVIIQDSEKFKSVYPTVDNVYGNFLFGLSSSGDAIFLYDKEGNEVDKVLYGTSAPWPMDPSGIAATLELVDPFENNDVGGNWKAGVEGGTPGKRNSVTTSVGEILVKNEMMAVCFPTVFNEYTTLQFYNGHGSPYLVQVIDMQGRLINEMKGKSGSDELVSIELLSNQANYKKGIYMVRVTTNAGSDIIKVTKK